MPLHPSQSEEMRFANPGNFNSWQISQVLRLRKEVAIRLLAVSNLVVGERRGFARGRDLGRGWILPLTLMAVTPLLLRWSYISEASVRGCDLPVSPFYPQTVIPGVIGPLIVTPDWTTLQDGSHFPAPRQSIRESLLI